jgi:uroporphyrinogen-III decarboxylase
MASMLIGLEDIMFLIHDNPDFLIKIIEIGFNNAIGCAKAQIEAGANMIWIGDTMASSWVISLEQFKKWALPYQKKLIDYIHNYDVYTFIQMHEKETDRIELMLQTDSDIINVANKADLKEAVNAIKGKKCLFGNIDPESVLFQGTPLKIKEKIDECISIAARGGGYIIGCCDNLPRYTPEENYKFFFDYVKSINLIL